ncbi:MAG: TetR/AcrR family transcriptional regulator [Actinomycetota bacterium]|nr:TetR/AcrR family transcriptional regulator [Actinomycetota bacterium]
MDPAVRMRARVLAAAEETLLEGGFQIARLHSTIARRAGLSRPTVYKYVGDQDAIIAAVIQHQFEAFLARLAPVLDQHRTFSEHLVEVMTFVVGEARAHPLLRVVMRDTPERLLPWFTTHAGRLIEQVEPLVVPGVRHYIERGELPAIDPRILTDALCRIGLSLVFTNGLFDVSDPDALRAYLTALLPVRT